MNNLLGWTGSTVACSPVPHPHAVSLWPLDIILRFFLSCFSLNTWNNRRTVMQSVSAEWCVHSMLLREWRIWHQNIWCVWKYMAHWDSIEDCLGQKKPDLAWSWLRNDLSSEWSISGTAARFTLEGGNTLVCFTGEPGNWVTYLPFTKNHLIYLTLPIHPKHPFPLKLQETVV